MIHRHLEVRPGTPADELPLAAIADLLERGDLEDWRPVAAAIRRDPYGRLAEEVMHLLDANPMYGTSPLWRWWIDRCRARAEGSERPRYVTGLAPLRRELGLTQAELAPRVGISQSDLSKLERRQDLRLSTLRAYVEALGGRLRIFFESSVERVEVRWPARRERQLGHGVEPEGGALVEPDHGAGSSTVPATLP
ncbi:MAG TPA: helix-turn-helix transcriptional regulator [Thermoanaerobaculia bacterium]|nr:helix-turn-helix transcriptional regulator [Thermoanaerobaculia bacterium]